MAKEYEALYRAAPQCTEQAFMQATTMLSQGIPVRLKFGPTGKSFINGAGYKVGISHVIPEVYVDGEWIPVVSKTGSNGIPYVTTDRNGDGIPIHDPQYISLQEGMKRWLVHRDLSSEEM